MHRAGCQQHHQHHCLKQPCVVGPPYIRSAAAAAAADQASASHTCCPAPVAAQIHQECCMHVGQVFNSRVGSMWGRPPCHSATMLLLVYCVQALGQWSLCGHGAHERSALLPWVRIFKLACSGSMRPRLPLAPPLLLPSHSQHWPQCASSCCQPPVCWRRRMAQAAAGGRWGKTPSAAGVEPATSTSGGWHAIHCVTRPGA